MKYSSAKKQKLPEGAPVRERIVDVVRPHAASPQSPLVHKFDKNHLWIIFVAALIFLALLSFRLKPAKADVATFYPSTCLGGWANPKNAANQPDLKPEAEPALFTPDNSAVINNEIAQLFCGNFTGTIPSDSDPKKIILTFSWALKDSNATSSESSSSVITVPTDGFDSSTAQEIIDSESTASVTVATDTSTEATDSSSQIDSSASSSSSTETVSSQQPDTAAGNSSQDTNASSAPATAPDQSSADQASSPGPQVTGSVVSQPSQDNSNPAPSAPPATDNTTNTSVPSDNSVPATSDQPSAFLMHFFDTAFADEIPNSTNTSVTATDSGSGVGLTDSSSSTASDTSTQGQFTASSSAVADSLLQNSDHFIEVDYTLDGVTWGLLGTVGPSNWSNAQFEIPLDQLDTWSDISQLQIRVQSLLTVDNEPSVYLDGMSLAVQYDAGPKQTATSTDQTALPINPLDLKIHLSAAVNESMKAEVQQNDQQQDVLKISAPPLTSLRFYKLEDQTFSMIGGVGDDKVETPAYFFTPGDYTVIDTSDPAACANLSLSECRSQDGYVDELSFSVVDITASTTPEETN